MSDEILKNYSQRTKADDLMSVVRAVESGLGFDPYSWVSRTVVEPLTSQETMWQYFPFEYYKALVIKHQTEITDELLRGQSFGL